MKFDFEELYNFIEHCSASKPIRKLRLTLFENYWYAEDYEKVYKLIIDLGGTIE